MDTTSRLGFPKHQTQVQPFCAELLHRPSRSDSNLTDIEDAATWGRSLNKVWVVVTMATDLYSMAGLFFGHFSVIG